MLRAPRRGGEELRAGVVGECHVLQNTWEMHSAMGPASNSYAFLAQRQGKCVPPGNKKMGICDFIDDLKYYHDFPDAFPSSRLFDVALFWK